MTTPVRGLDPCPCGSGEVLAACCGRVIDGRPAATAEQLMRSRYTAFVLGDVGHLVRSWHPRTRPVDLDVPRARVWEGLRVLGASDGGADDEVGTVTFEARYVEGGRRGVQREVSRFERRRGAWVYVDAER